MSHVVNKGFIEVLFVVVKSNFVALISLSIILESPNFLSDFDLM
jgi:hypothetical protein